MCVIGGNVPGQPVYSTTCQEETDGAVEGMKHSSKFNTLIIVKMYIGPNWVKVFKLKFVLGPSIPEPKTENSMLMLEGTLPAQMVNKYRQRYQAARKADQQMIETCLRAVTCVVVGDGNQSATEASVELLSCKELQENCITLKSNAAAANGQNEFSQNGDGSSTFLDTTEAISADRLALTFLEGEKSWSPNHRRHFLECKIQDLLCHLPEVNEEGSGDDINDYVDIRAEGPDHDNSEDIDAQICVNGKMKSKFCRLIGLFIAF